MVLDAGVVVDVEARVVELEVAGAKRVVVWMVVVVAGANVVVVMLALDSLLCLSTMLVTSPPSPKEQMHPEMSRVAARAKKADIPRGLLTRNPRSPMESG